MNGFYIIYKKEQYFFSCSRFRYVRGRYCDMSRDSYTGSDTAHYQSRSRCKLVQVCRPGSRLALG